jgi:hypothetical protein
MCLCLHSQTNYDLLPTIVLLTNQIKYFVNNWEKYQNWVACVNASIEIYMESIRSAKHIFGHTVYLQICYVIYSRHPLGL